MAKAYSDDLRRKLLEAHDRGEGSLAELARRFGVSVPWAWKISRQRRRSGQMERVEQRHGPLSRITAEVQRSLRGLVRQQPDATLVELQQRLWASERIRISVQHLWRALIEAVGPELLYLSPYSPDFNPIEQAWSKIKQQLRSAKARTLETLEFAITDALAAITPNHAAAWFAHCGYAI